MKILSRFIVLVSITFSYAALANVATLEQLTGAATKLVGEYQLVKNHDLCPPTMALAFDESQNAVALSYWGNKEAEALFLLEKAGTSWNCDTSNNQVFHEPVILTQEASLDKKGRLMLEFTEKVDGKRVDRNLLPYHWPDRALNIYFWTTIYKVVEQETPGRVDVYEPAPGDYRSFMKRTSKCQYQKKD